MAIRSNCALIFTSITIRPQSGVKTRTFTPSRLFSSTRPPLSTSSSSHQAESKSNLSREAEIYDVVTVGGGPVGLALLAALKSSPQTSHLKTCLIESQPLSNSRSWSLPADQYSNRASSLTPTSVAFLDLCNVWSHVDKTRIRPFQAMHVWDAGANDASIQFDWKADARKYNAPARTVATMVENANLTKALLQRIDELGGTEDVFDGMSVAKIEDGVDSPDGKGWDLSSWPTLTLSQAIKPGSINSEFSSSSQAPTQSKRIVARLLIGADGFNSPVRTYAGIDSKGWDYGRHGVVATLKLEPPESSDMDSMYSSYENDVDSEVSTPATAYQRFLPQFGGPIAILPLPNNHASLVWSTTPQNAAYLKTLDEKSLVATLNAALRLSQTDIKYMFTLPTSTSTSPSTSSTTSSEFQSQSQSQHESELLWRLQHTPPSSSSSSLPTIKSVQPNTLASFPLRFRQATTYTGSSRIALIGDAAHTVHPLAGQGLNLGLGDANCLAETLAYAVTHGMDLGDPFVLERFASQRFGRGLLMGGVVDFMEKLYGLGGSRGGEDGITGEVTGWLRGVGMGVVNSPGLGDALKGFIMRRAEG